MYSNLDLKTESDVEQKFILKLLTTAAPLGLGYFDSDFKTKPDIRKITIDKGTKAKLYYPDYIIIINGIPSLVIEAKTPGDDLNEAIRQGRLYATEINSKFKKRLNPCNKIIVTDGIEVMAGYWDTEQDYIKFKVENIDPTDIVFAQFLDFASKTTVEIHSKEILKDIKKGSTFIKPTQMLGGKAVVSEIIGQNSFGANISLEYKYLFNPDTLDERESIVSNAYVTSKRRESHVAPIDKIIRASVPPTQINSIGIEDTKNPKELISRFTAVSKLKNQLCLLIGDAGSGKSTFTDYLRKVALPTAITNCTEWININLNKAPLSKDMIYMWVVSAVIDAIKMHHHDIDFNKLQTLKVMYANELNVVEKGRAALYPKDSESYINIIYKELERLQLDQQITLNSLINYIISGKNKLLVVVFDNCDKRNREDQLLMFEVATWLKDSFNCMIFLPIRDTTYDNYCNEPPLDTVIKDLVFRIDPPLLEKVVYERLNYALREIKTDTSKFHYFLSNNLKVECSRNEVGIYLKCIIATLFQDTYFKSIITGLAGRNIRRGLEVILEFCKSGYISENDIFQIRQSEGEFHLPPHQVATILIRGKSKYYSDSSSSIKNLFYSDKNEDLPDPFVRISILNWLKGKFREHGPNRTKGYHKVKDIVSDLQAYGHSRERILAEVQNFILADCIYSESFEPQVDNEDLISIAPAGFIHLDLLKNITYLSSVAEDTYFRENQVAKKIAENLTDGGKYHHHSKQANISGSKVLIDYMISYFDEYFPDNTEILGDGCWKDYLSLSTYKEYIERIIESDKGYVDTERLIIEYPKGTVVEALVVSTKTYGAFVRFNTNGKGILQASIMNSEYKHKVNNLNEGEWVRAEIIEYNSKHSRFTLKLTD